MRKETLAKKSISRGLRAAPAPPETTGSAAQPPSSTRSASITAAADKCLSQGAAPTLVILRSKATKDPIRFPRRTTGSLAALGMTRNPAQAAVLSRSPYGLPPGSSPRLCTTHSLRGGRGVAWWSPPRFLSSTREAHSFFYKRKNGGRKKKTHGTEYLPHTQQVEVYMRFFAALRMTDETSLAALGRTRNRGPCRLSS